MLFNFLKFLGLKHNEKYKRAVGNSKEIEETQIIDSEQTHKIEEVEIIKNEKEKIKQVIEIQPLGNGKALKIVRSKTIGR